MMAEAGKDFEMLQILEKDGGAHPEGIKDSYGSSHPSTTYRLLALEELSKKSSVRKKQDHH